MCRIIICAWSSSSSSSACYCVFILFASFLIAFSSCISINNNKDSSNHNHNRNDAPIMDSPPSPNRRFYFYHPDLLSHAAAALGMIAQPAAAYYKPINPLQFEEYGAEEEEEESYDHYEHKNPIQFLTFIKPKKTKIKKNKKNKTFKKVKKGAKKCLPFKVRIIKKSDLNTSDQIPLPYGYRNEYYPSPTMQKDTNMALISLNTSALLPTGNGTTQYPEMVHFLYHPRYVLAASPPQPPLRTRGRPKKPKKRFRPKRPLRKRLIRPRKPWPQINSWKVATPGKPITEFPLREPNPSSSGGSPPPSPLFNIYKDNRIPISQNYVIKGTTQQSPNNGSVAGGVEPNYVHLHSPTGQYHWSEPYNEVQTTIKPEKIETGGGYSQKYSEPDYYRYGTYTQQQQQFESHPPRPVYVTEPPAGYQHVPQTQKPTNYVTVSTERIITVTPTTSWVPLPQYPHYRSSHQQGKQGPEGEAEEASKQKHRYEFGDKIRSQNCTSLSDNSIENCQNGGGNSKMNKMKRRRVVNRKGTYKYNQSREDFSENNPVVETSTNRFTKPSKISPGKLSSKFYIEEISSALKTSKEVRGGDNRTGRVAKRQIEIVTAKYPQDDVRSLAMNGSKTGLGDFRAVVSSSMMVEEK